MKRLPLMLVGIVAFGDQAAADLNVEWGNPEAVAIIGYSGPSEEPFLAPYNNIMLFDSHTDDPTIPSKIFQAYRLDYKTFLILGEVQGVNIPGASQGSPNIDAFGNFYFQTNAFYTQNLMTSYRGTFNGGVVTNVTPVFGISRLQPYWVTMEAEISGDGNTLIFGDFHFDPNLPLSSSQLVFAVRNSDGSFTRVPNSDQVLANVNALGATVYNGILSWDGLELYFTMLNPEPAGPQIYVAKRNAPTEPFGVPQLIFAAGNMVESGSLSPDGKHLYYHRVLALDSNPRGYEAVRV
jgi:hypothetical protein